MKRTVLYVLLATLAITALLVTGCAEAFQTSGSSNPDTQNAEQPTGRLVVKVTDAPIEEIDNVNVTVSYLAVHKAGSTEDEDSEEDENGEVEAAGTGSNTEEEQEQEQEQEQERGKGKGKSNKNQNQNLNQNQEVNSAGTDDDDDETGDGGWIELAFAEDIDLDGNSEGVTFNLLDFQNGLEGLLAEGTLETGKYTQIRMEISQIELVWEGEGEAEDTVVEAKLPGGKLKFVHPFEIAEDQVTELIFDIVASKSIHVTGNNQYIFKPVIKLNSGKPARENDEEENEAEETEELVITTESLPAGKVGEEYEVVLQATGGVKPYEWNITGGEWPDGLALNTNSGVFHGTPDESGEFTIIVQVTDKESTSVTKTLTLSISAAEQEI